MIALCNRCSIPILQRLSYATIVVFSILEKNYRNLQNSLIKSLIHTMKDHITSINMGNRKKNM